MTQNQMIQLIRAMTDDEAKRWLRFKQNKKLLLEYWEQHFPILKPKNMGEIIHVIKYDISPLCDYQNHRSFKQFPKGYHNRCAGGSCHCFYEVRSAINQKIPLSSRLRGKEKAKSTNLERYGVDNVFKSKAVQDRIKATLKEKHDVDNISQLPEIKEKKKQTSRQRYGVDHPSQNREVALKKQKTTHERYGGNSPFSSVEVRKKARATLKSRYGVENFFLRKDFQEKIIQHRLEKFGYSNPGQRFLSQKTLEILADRELFASHVAGKCYEQIAIDLDTSPFTIANYVRKYDCFGLLSPGNISCKQDEITKWLTSLGIKVVSNIRSIIPPKEIDIFLPDYNLAIEYNGTYYHSEISGNKPKDYHRKKYLDCRDKNIDLMQISSDHYLNNPGLVKSMIKSRLGLNERIMARNCYVKVLSFRETSEFLSSNHLQHNKTTGSVRLGLMHNHKLVMVMTFGKARMSHEDSWELIRMASEIDLTIVGGASKLFSYFIRNYSPTSIVSYSDLRYFSGRSLQNLGFIKVGESGPGYWYTKNYKDFFHRFSFRKSELTKKIGETSRSEWEIMQDMGYDRIWDCGHAKWQYTKEEK